MSVVLSNKIFIEKSLLSHRVIFDYSRVEYKNAREKVCIICPEHGEFWQRADYHMKGGNCPTCGRIEGINKLKLQGNEFKSKAYKIHGNTYDYSLSKCYHSRSKITIICKIHGEFQQSVHNHLQGSGCPKCQSLCFSSGELRIKNWLKRKRIEFIPQKKFDDCKNERCLPFDFYLTEYNICIEYDGKQHFDKSSKFYCPEVLRNDSIKNKYCLDRGIKLVRISFHNFTKIEKILDIEIRRA